MSWGNSASGSAAQVKDTGAGWAPAVLKNDTQFRAGPISTAVHQAQTKQATSAIGEIVDAYPEGTVFTVSVGGSCQEGSGSGSLNVSYVASCPIVDADATGVTSSEGAKA